MTQFRISNKALNELRSTLEITIGTDFVNSISEDELEKIGHLLMSGLLLSMKKETVSDNIEKYI
ncbi:hypothetical protein KC865_03605 [Candidatus Kaiserbacteria bacterium]|nr:hypothetical protein [Candidatus Kaiserbacteria bacterium]USN91942.1 MAG: hypothetical protein H6782_03645 [Candidatus Nomurabacteria bacterium]